MKTMKASPLATIRASARILDVYLECGVVDNDSDHPSLTTYAHLDSIAHTISASHVDLGLESF